MDLSVDSCTSFTNISSNILCERREEDLRRLTPVLDTFSLALSNTASLLKSSIFAKTFVSTVRALPKSFLDSSSRTLEVSKRFEKRSGNLSTSRYIRKNDLPGRRHEKSIIELCDGASTVFRKFCHRFKINVRRKLGLR